MTKTHGLRVAALALMAGSVLTLAACEDKKKDDTAQEQQTPAEENSAMDQIAPTGPGADAIAPSDSEMGITMPQPDAVPNAEPAMTEPAAEPVATPEATPESATEGAPAQ